MKRAGDDGIANGGALSSERKEGHAKLSVEGIRSSAENSDVVGPVDADDVGFEELRGRVRTVDEDIGLAEIAESLQDVSGGDEIALRVDEEGVSEKSVANALVAGRFVARVNDRADGGPKRRSGLPGRLLLGGGAKGNSESERDEEERNRTGDWRGRFVHGDSIDEFRVAQPDGAREKVGLMCEQIVTSANDSPPSHATLVVRNSRRACPWDDAKEDAKEADGFLADRSADSSST